MTDYTKTALRIGELVQTKQKAYGSSFSKTGAFFSILYPDGIKPDQYTDALLLARMFDKMMRVVNHKDAFGENPYEDLVGYGLLGAARDAGPIVGDRNDEPDEVVCGWCGIICTHPRSIESGMCLFCESC